MLRDLEPETTHEVRIASLFGSHVSRYSSIQTFTTPQVQVAACGEAPALPVKASTKPLLTAMAGQYWQVGDFSMQVRGVRGSDGVFSGWGVMRIPYLSMQAAVKFDNVWIDEDYNLVKGEVIALSEGIEVFQKRWEKEQAEQQQEVVAQGQGSSNPEASANGQVQTETATVTVVGDIATVYVNEQGQVVAVDSEGKEAVVAEEVPAEGTALAVVDSKGNSYSVDSGGGVSKGKGGGGNANKDNNANRQPQFTIEEKIVIAVLESFQKDVEAWLEVYGKGPLSEYEMRMLEKLPGCLPEDPETVVGANDYITYLLEEKESYIPAFTQKIKGNPEWSTITSIGANISNASEMSGENMEKASEAVCPYILDEAINYAQCSRCPKPDHVGQEGEEALTFDPAPVNAKRRGAKRWYYFAGYAQSAFYSAPNNIDETGAGWYGWEDYLKHIERVIESIAIVSGDVYIHSINEERTVRHGEDVLTAFESGRDISDNFKELVAKEYSRVSKEAFNKYSGSGYLEPVYPIYEILGLFTGKQF